MLLFVTVVAVGVFAYVRTANLAKQAKRESQSNTTALCALRLDLERRVESSREFLKKHPEGFEGISPEEIQVSINNQARTIEALSSLDC